MFTAETRRAPARSPEHLLEVRSLTKRYGPRDALTGLSLSVDPGEIVGLVGSNGSGKTTSLRILSGLLRPDAGAGVVLGFDIMRESDQVRRRVGYLSQRYSLYAGLSVKENLYFRAEAFGVDDAVRAVSAVIDRFALRPFETLPAERLSGGWARQLQLAAALVHAPQLLLLDEPTAGLDAVARQAVWRQITRLASEGTAIVLSTHDLVDASRCSRIAFLSGGTIRISGRPADLVCSMRGTVLAIFGSRVLSLMEQLHATVGVITSYPSGECLRVVIAPGAEARVINSPHLREFVVERVSPTLEDAVLALSAFENLDGG
ncbi:MAG TPA: ABC transporter ATP-binding protein [Steroidobacteraceae bacterium]